MDEHQKNELFVTLKSNLMHRMIEKIFSPLKSAMKEPKIMRCGDGFYRRVILSIGAHIVTDAVEEAAIAGIMYGWCPK